MTDFIALEQDIRAATRQAFTELVSRSSPETICAFALYSDEGAMTVCPAANTRTHLAATQAEDPESSLYYKFSPAEWKFEGEGADEAFNAICSQLAARLETDDEGNDDEAGFIGFRTALFGACAATLKSLKAEHFFEATAGGPVMLLFAVSDSDITASDVTLVKELNDAATANEFEDWAGPFNES